MNRIACLIVVLCLVFTAAGCAGKTPVPQTSPRQVSTRPSLDLQELIEVTEISRRLRADNARLRKQLCECRKHDKRLTVPPVKPVNCEEEDVNFGVLP
ncbi:MAG: hypothetical protein HQ530_02100 [Parcubacteria group bacterium]|nr:hypothetical protein [Parcubacteria group bacterium]